MREAASISTARGTRELTRHKLLIRKPGAGWPFVWRGLLPLLGLLAVGLYAVWPFARGEIEANVRRSVTQAFLDKGLTEVDVSVSGQQVLLTGRLKPGLNTLDALSIARSATCPTWLGPQVCPDVVIGQFQSELAMPAAPALPEAAAAASAAADVIAHEACERALAQIVDSQQIAFETGSARLAASSAGVLDAVVKAHADCKRVLRVQGHTDNQGNADSNQKLSLARANAVRDALIRRGVAAEDLVAEGFGDTRPKADNATAQGRELNRRIEFRVARPN